MNQTNGRTLSNEQAINILGGAFKPLCCVAQTQNVGTLMVFEVTDGTKRILKQGIPAALAHNDYNLRAQIMGARNEPLRVPADRDHSFRRIVISDSGPS